MFLPPRRDVLLAQLSVALTVTITLCLAVPRQAQSDRDATAGAATIASIHMVDLRTGWAIAAVGTATDAIMRTTEGSRAWSLLHPSVVPPLPGEGRHLHVPLTRGSDLSFVDALHGWALGISCPATDGTCSLVLRATNDGGRTWRALPAPTTAPPYRGDAGNTVHVGSIRFADVHDGWAFGPGLYATRDGGRTWSPDRRIGAVVALAPRGRSVWAISSTCPVLSGTTQEVHRQQLQLARPSLRRVQHGKDAY
jgi:photosystem II stability/assembly factor-like uncharacterized protein